MDQIGSHIGAKSTQRKRVLMLKIMRHINVLMTIWDSRGFCAVALIIIISE